MNCPNCGAPVRKVSVLVAAVGQFNDEVRIEQGSVMIYRPVEGAPPPHFIEAPADSCEYCEVDLHD